MPNFNEIHIENTNACGYKCTMCPRDKHTRKIGYMSLEDFNLVLDRVAPFNGIFHLHGFGEPLLDRLLAKKAEAAKAKFPNSSVHIISTLGVRLKEKNLEDIVQSGLDAIIVSFYGFERETYKNIHGYDGFLTVKANLETLSRLIKKHKAPLIILAKVPGSTISSTLPVAEEKGSKEFLSWLTDLGFDYAHWSSVHNYGDGRQYNEPGETKLCPVINGLRKHILNVTWNLNVIPCCFDFNASIKFGNLRESNIPEIFSSPEYLEFVINHQTNSLKQYPVCQNCEKRDY